jgi:ankyrin repeat protein
MSALHWAVVLGNIEILQLLVGAGANLEVQDKVSTCRLLACDFVEYALH